MSDVAHGAPPFRTERLFGLDLVADASIADVARWLVADGARRVDKWRCVVTPNVDHVVRYDRNPAEAETAAGAYLALPDGMPIVWASRLLGRRLAARLTGADLFTAMWEQLSRESTAVVVVAPDIGVARGLAEEHQGVRCVVPGRVDVSDEPTVAALIDEIARACEESAARFLVVGLSMEKHHLVAKRLRDRWTPSGFAAAPIVLLLGASPELHLGITRRAPPWMQRSGFEWLYRFVQEPKRLFKRYFVDDVRFVRLVVREWRGR